MFWFKDTLKMIREFNELKQKIARLERDLNILSGRIDGFEATLRHADMIIEQPKGRTARKFTSNDRQ